MAHPRYRRGRRAVPSRPPGKGPRHSRAPCLCTQARRAKGRGTAFRGPVPVRETLLCPTAAPPPAPRGERGPSSSARRDTRPSSTSTVRDDSARPGARRTYVLDTSVLLADPAAIGRVAEHRVVLPVVVITQLEAKGPHPDVGYFARPAPRPPADL